LERRVPGQGVVMEGVKETNKPPGRSKYTKTFLEKNRQKRRFLLKVLNKIYSQDVF
jgi:hypothetical protein